MNQTEQTNLLNEYFNNVTETFFEYPGFVSAVLDDHKYVILNNLDEEIYFEIYESFESYNNGVEAIEFVDTNIAV